ncbi:unnamed protein product [Amaranthus hypochondriacus]
MPKGSDCTEKEVQQPDTRGSLQDPMIDKEGSQNSPSVTMSRQKEMGHDKDGEWTEKELLGSTYDQQQEGTVAAVLTDISVEQAIGVQKYVLEATHNSQQLTIHPLEFTENGFSVLDMSTDIDTLVSEVPSSKVLGANPISNNE